MRSIKILAVIILVIMPYSTVLSRFSPYLTKYTFNNFLAASLIFAVVSMLLILFIRNKKDKSVSLMTGSSLFLLLGSLVAPPLMLGPPEVTAMLQQRTVEEHFRYGMLFFATLVFAAGFIVIIKTLWNNLHAFHKGIIIPFAATLVLWLWDNYSSYQFSSELAEWARAGKGAEDFFPQYDFRETIRTLGRCLMYFTTLWLSFILFQKGWLKKWVFVILALFCTIGILSFFALVITEDGGFYFLLIPAIVLAPAYWAGIALVSKASLKG